MGVSVRNNSVASFCEECVLWRVSVLIWLPLIHTRSEAVAELSTSFWVFTDIDVLVFDTKVKVTLFIISHGTCGCKAPYICSHGTLGVISLTLSRPYPRKVHTPFTGGQVYSGSVSTRKCKENHYPSAVPDSVRTIQPDAKCLSAYAIWFHLWLPSSSEFCLRAVLSLQGCSSAEGRFSTVN